MRPDVVFFVGVAAALLLAVGYVVQQRVAASMPLSDLLRIRLLFDLMHRPMWWAGIGTMVAGQILSGLALQMATVGVVEPLLSTNLLFALAVAALLAGRRPSWSEVGGAVLLSAALGVFLAVGNPRSLPSAARGGVPVIVLTVVAVLGLVAVCVMVGRSRGLVGESIWLATGAGVLYGLQDAATRGALVMQSKHGFVAMLTNQWIWIVVSAATIGILLAQNAFKAARLDYSLPPITAAEPIVGIAIGIAVLGDTVSVSVLGLAVEFSCLAAMVVAVILIGHSPGLAACTVDVRPDGEPEAEAVRAA
jgi:drug/metabolite transporter (DMT)-like permease